MRALPLLFLLGCFESHVLGASRDAAGIDSATRDSGTDATPRDGGPRPSCEVTMVTETTAVYGGAGASNPRLVALPGNEIGVVTQDVASMEVYFQRFSVDLEATTPPVRIESGASGHVAAAFLDGLLHVSTRFRNDSEGQVRSYGLDGGAAGVGGLLNAFMPSQLYAAGDRLLWIGVEREASSTIRAVHVDAEGAPLHPPRDVDTSTRLEHDVAVLRPDGRSHVLSYLSNTTAQVGARILSADGTLGPERIIAEGNHSFVAPLNVDGRLLLIRFTDDNTVIEHLDFDTLGPIARYELPATSFARDFASLRGHVVMFSISGGSSNVAVHDVSPSFDSINVNEYGRRRLFGSPDSLTLPDAIVFAIQFANEANQNSLWLLRFECI